ncbi:hypothetical protein C7B80_30980 [Cyanosarcina cf. burmensis CCALA 770]|nr:hypothetical protein C7B80_30980 [Cyanosarcina cf. burmensis CCALA 770]
MYKAWKFQRLVLLGLILSPVSLLGLVLEPLVVATMLTPPQGEPTPEYILKPVTYRDYALLGQHLFGRAKTRKAMQESVAACNKAINLAPSSGDGYMCRAFPLAALGSKAQAVKDVSTAKTLYLRAGNEKEAGIIDRFELKNLVKNQPPA